MKIGPRAEIAYREIKKRLLAGIIKPGQQLDAPILADELNISQTPVRDALHVLTGEGLIVTGTGGGFYASHIDIPHFRDLYGWNAQILKLALDGSKMEPDGQLSPDKAPQESSVDSIARAFLLIARRSPNSQHAEEIRSINEKLSTARHVEVNLFTDVKHEIRGIWEAIADGDKSSLHKRIKYYHKRRQDASVDIIRAIFH